jgi:alpha-tubulin suppressor-like RCC1 family protein
MLKRIISNVVEYIPYRRNKDNTIPLIPDLNSIVLEYLPKYQLFDMKKLYPQDVQYYLGEQTIEELIRGKQRISCGVNHAMYLPPQGQIYAYGGNDYGQSGYDK